MKSAAFLALVFMSGMAAAAPVDYTFNVYFDGGGPAGAVPVNVTLDGVTGTGIETFTPSLGNLLAFDFDQVRTFGITNDEAFPTAPLIALADGALTDINYKGRESVLGGRITYSAFIELSGQANSTTYGRVGPGIFDLTRGEVAPETWRRVTSIPEPTSALFLCSTGALACLRRRRG